MIKLVLVWALALVFIYNSLRATLRSNWNAGTLMMWLVSALLVAYGVFHRAIDAFTAAGAGFVLKVLFWCGAGIFAALMVFLALAGRSRTAKGDEAAIIVLGAGLWGKKVGGVLRYRLQTALAAHKENPAALLVVSGGQGKGEEVSEAAAMAAWLEDKGVAPEDIIREDRSVSTETNLRYSKALLEGRGIGAGRPVAVVTNTFHCCRARLFAKREGFGDVRMLPAPLNATNILPNYMREVLAFLYMALLRR